MKTSKTLTALALLGTLGIAGTLGAGVTNDALAQAMPSAVQVQAMTKHVSARDHSGKAVYTQSGREIGKVKDMVQGSSDSKVYAIITLGGPVLATATREVTIPAAEMSFTSDRAVLTRDATKALVTATQVYEVDSTRQVME